MAAAAGYKKPIWLRSGTLDLAIWQRQILMFDLADLAEVRSGIKKMIWKCLMNIKKGTKEQKKKVCQLVFNESHHLFLKRYFGENLDYLSSSFNC